MKAKASAWWKAPVQERVPRMGAFDVRDSATTPCVLFPELFNRLLSALLF
jgi:hypothetical protein